MIYDKINPLLKTRKRLEQLSNPKKRLFDDPIKYNSVYFPEFDNLLKVLAPPPLAVDQFNCYAYALRLSKWVHKYTLVQALEKKHLIPTASPKKGDIVIYFGESRINHAGRYISESKVKSKWAGGPTFEHDTFMCPTHYGNRVEYYNAITIDEAEKIFSRYPIPNI